LIELCNSTFLWITESATKISEEIKGAELKKAKKTIPKIVNIG
jgi:hypothetical protein